MGQLAGHSSKENLNLFQVKFSPWSRLKVSNVSGNKVRLGLGSVPVRVSICSGKG